MQHPESELPFQFSCNVGSNNLTMWFVVGGENVVTINFNFNFNCYNYNVTFNPIQLTCSTMSSC